MKNSQNTLLSFLRWIPKLILNNEENTHRITTIDNFQTLTNLEPVRLTTKRLRKLPQATHLNPVEQEPINDINDEDFELYNNANRDDDSDDSRENDQKVNENVFLVLEGNGSFWNTYA
ncbi:unnamed protein product [Rotaria sp. Silwood2]|nr:unnamed protein product [Rotaria sp. Silwood2]CAF4284875.1 unnamed protein product [Rotaria sp. Silwood2]